MGRLGHAGQLEHLKLGIAIRVADHELHQEPVELGLGQGICSLVLDRVLGGQHPEGLGQDKCLVTDRDLAFLHGFQQRALDLRRGPVDLVGKQHAGDDGARADVKCAGRRPVDLGARQIRRQQVRGELDPPERQIESLRESSYGPGLGQAGDALDQDMTAGQESDHESIEQGSLTDDHVLKSLDQSLQPLLRRQDGRNRERGIVGGHESANPSRSGWFKTWKPGGVPSVFGGCHWPRRCCP